MTSSNDSMEEFTQDDRDRLAGSNAWQEDSGFVESLCRLLYQLDPMGLGCWSGGNPHAMTEYLLEVEMIAKKLPDIGSVRELSVALQAVFQEMFEGQSANCDLEELAEAAWPIALRWGAEKIRH